MIPTSYAEARALVEGQNRHIRLAGHEIRHCKAMLSEAEERLKKLEAEAVTLALFAEMLRTREALSPQEAA